MDFIKIYKENEIIKDYVNIYFDDETLKYDNVKINYKILHIIGNGVYGVVYKADRLDNCTVVALKQTYQRSTKIFKEVEIMKTLKHPNIVKLKHAFYTSSSSGGVYVHMVMEYGNTDLATSLYYITIKNSAQLKRNHSATGGNDNRGKTYNNKNEINCVPNGDLQCGHDGNSNLDSNGRSYDCSGKLSIHDDNRYRRSVSDGVCTVINCNSRRRNSECTSILTNGTSKEDKKIKLKIAEEGENLSYHPESLDPNYNDSVKYINTSGNKNPNRCANLCDEGSNKEGESTNGLGNDIGVGRKDSSGNGNGNVNDSINGQKKYNNLINNFNINAIQESISNICPSHNLSEYIKKSFLNENQIKIYLYQLIRATLYLHSLCITHRDIKPQNILIFLNKSSNNLSTNKKGEHNKQCLVCIQNSFKFRCIMNRRNMEKMAKSQVDGNNYNDGTGDGIGNGTGDGTFNAMSDMTSSQIAVDKGVGDDKENFSDRKENVGDPIYKKRDDSVFLVNNNGNEINEKVHVKRSKNISPFNEQDHTVNCSIERRMQKHDKYCNKSSTSATLKSRRSGLKNTYVRLKRSMSMTCINKGKHSLCNNSNDNPLHISKKNMKKDVRKDKTDIVMSSHTYKNHAIVEEQKIISVMGGKIGNRSVDVRRSTNDESSDSSDAIIRGSDAVSCGRDEISRGRNEISRGIDEISRGIDEISRGSDEISRGSDEISRGSDEISRGSDEISRGSDDDDDEAGKKAGEAEEKKLIVGEEVTVSNMDDLSEENNLEKLYMNNIVYKFIKLCDFNTSIKLKENYKYFSYVCSRYYRAPELLFGSNYYSQAIDTWSIGMLRE
ncbi:protein kinase 1, putative (PK1) [Plasmodium ovale curtisi]|uniref:Protein kinase 1, putative (PK1) n=1 Tax=Plasmodium ovale curtisi TaxID=864141 RepID=A0A1A8VS07_PLAOA|nr:protein kinase 1, putative (PK1) [Plasmodium ovale curtisi]SBS82460.1 protein kinase 1, putative (PK1) [Plasmodium ovale curtisi]